MAVYSNRFFLPVLLLVVNIISKCVYLTFQDICIDEPFTIYHAQFDLPYLIQHLKNYNNPPLYEIILHFWIKCFGISPESVRTLPMLFSSVTVIFIYQIGLRFFDKRIAILASILYTLSTLNIWFAHDCRVYSLFVLLTVASFYLFFMLLKEPLSFKKTALFFFTLVNILLVYGHYFGFIVWGLEFLIICIFFLRAKLVLKKYFISTAISLLIYIPQLMVMWERTKDSVSNGTWLNPPKGLESIYNMLWSFCNEPISTVICILFLLCCIILFFVRKKIQPINEYSKYIIIWFLVPFLGMFFISYKIPMFLDRYLIFISPAFYLMLAVAVSYLFKKPKIYLGSSIVLILVFFFSATLNPSKKNKIKDTVDYIKTQQDKNTLVIVGGSNFVLNFAYYYDRESFKIKDQTIEYGFMENILKNKNVYFVNFIDDKLLSTITTFDRVIYFDAATNFSIPGNTIKETLYNKHQFINRTYFYQEYIVYSFKINKN